VTRQGGRYHADAVSADDAEPFYMKPSALGDYLLYNASRQLVTGNTSVVTNAALANASPASQWTVLGVGDTTNYPETPRVDEEPNPEALDAYRNFDDPNLEFVSFTLGVGSSDRRLAVKDDGMLFLAQRDESVSAQGFSFAPVSGCAEFPEAQSNMADEDPTGLEPSFKGTLPDGRVLGHADVHVHISATTFLGGAQWGWPFHQYGVPHALGDCEELHGPSGTTDAVGAFLGGDFDGHDTTGWPTFPDWPARDMLTHEAIYWKWIERAWQAGLRLAVNDVVDNETLCELQRNVSGTPGADCNSMNNATDQVGTMYAMQDYIDAQYGGRGEGFFQIVLDPAQARSEIEKGNLAVVLGIEISNLLNCKVTYNPLRTQEPFEETGDPLAGGNTYGCTMEEGQPNSITTQLQRLHDLGIRQVISIHEFDNAFGGNGIFLDLLNVGNRENSGGIPSGDLAAITDLLESGAVDSISNGATPDSDDLIDLGMVGGAALADALANLEDGVETPTGEFWTTYNCPVEQETEGFSGYLWEDSGGEDLSALSPPGCVYTGQGGRPGGTTPCYPQANQCNARWMTPIGLYMYAKLMEMGFIFDFDHMELEMKTQALELTEAQPKAYPIVSTHGTFGGITNEQAQRVLRNGGYLYPSIGSSRGFREDMAETLQVYDQAVADLDPADRPLFAFGYGTDTNGLSAQSAPRGGDIEKPVQYPYTLFAGPLFDQMPEFDNVAGVTFEQPRTTGPNGNGRTWHEDIDGNAHYGMLSGVVEEIRLEGTAEEMRHLFNSAEAYLRTWERTVAAQDAINANGGVQVPDGLLRAAPTPDAPAPSPSPPAAP